MGESINPQFVVTTEEALRIEILVNQALVDILIAKQIVSEEELIEGIRKLKRQQQRLCSDSKTLTGSKKKIQNMN